MLSRKLFLKGSLVASASIGSMAHAAQLQRVSTLSAGEVASDEAFWQSIRAQYITGKLINLNNGGVNPQPQPVRDAYMHNYLLCNDTPSYSMWRELDKQREPLRKRLAELLGVSELELAFNRNTTEGLNSIIFGLDLKAGDEVVLSNFDYPNIENAWKQRAKRDGIKLNYVDLQMPATDDDAVVQQYADAITPRTKLVHITHMMNWTGHVMPVRRIADIAHAKGCEVMVDGSHSFAHLIYTIPQLGADYYATSCHKWLGAPFGTGLMYIRQDKIQKVWALLSAPIPDADNIGKFECLGTRSFAAEMTISTALDYYDTLGAERKLARLRYLKNYWVEKLQAKPGFKLYSSLQPQHGAAIATFGIEGLEAYEIESKLAQANIHTSIVKHGNVNGVRISPNLYTSLAELDSLVKVVGEMEK
ncbi:MAG: aminotransferase class V-fold PLP-dependent enzyme [Bacteroidetes bacterium]|nr:aminotransferase class V-fold PLP-dependent enzyme [Bacteroidota bacterium]